MKKMNKNTVATSSVPQKANVASNGGKVDTAPVRPAKAGKAQSQMPDYARLGIDSAEIAQLEDLRLQSQSLGRLTTDQVFKRGALVTTLHEIAPDQDSFVKLVGPVLGLSRRGAENYGSVYRHLQPYRDKLVAGGVQAAVLYKLAVAEPHHIEEALAVCEAGEALTGKRMSAILGQIDTLSGARPEDGGAAGLRARIAEKTALGVAMVMENGAALLEQILVALEPFRQGKRIVVKDTQRPLIHPTRLLREQIETLTWLAQPAGEGYAGTVVHVKPLTRDDQWYALWQTLEKLGGYEDWPAAGEVGPWLTETVVPQLEWLLGPRAAKANKVVEKLAREAEAEKAKAKQTADQAKLEKKKDRARAKKADAKAKLEAAREMNKAA